MAVFLFGPKFGPVPKKVASGQQFLFLPSLQSKTFTSTQELLLLPALLWANKLPVSKMNPESLDRFYLTNFSLDRHHFLSIFQNKFVVLGQKHYVIEFGKGLLIFSFRVLK